MDCKRKWCALFLYLFPTVHTYILVPQFMKVLSSLEGPGGEALRAKISYGLDQSYQLSLRLTDRGPIECYHELYFIMRDELKCPKSANEMKTYLNRLEFRYNMTKDENLVRSFYSKNCTWLGGRSASVCQIQKALVPSHVFMKIIDDCYLEITEGRGRRNVSMSRRLWCPDSYLQLIQGDHSG